jgi:hypothetical protein
MMSVSARKIASSSAPFDDVGGRPRFHNASHASDWAHLRLEFAARSMCESIAVWGQEMARLDNERSPTALAHESARAQRMVDFFEDHVTDPLMQGGMAHLILAVYTTIGRSPTSSGMSKLSASLFATDVRTASANLLSGRSHEPRWAAIAQWVESAMKRGYGVAPVRQHALPRSDRDVRARHEHRQSRRTRIDRQACQSTRIGIPVGRSHMLRQ